MKPELRERHVEESVTDGMVAAWVLESMALSLRGDHQWSR